jgi:putative nucleotidyltransferase with HDIG domain
MRSKEVTGMKKIAISLLLVLVAFSSPADSLGDLIKQALAENARGNATEALRVLGIAYATNPATAAAKRSLADAYAEVGVKEYDRRNFKNAYDCFKNAVKLSPTNQTASQYFWKMKNETDVDKLRNEGDDAAQKAPPSAPSGGAAAGGAAAVGGAAAGGAAAGAGAATVAAIGTAGATEGAVAAPAIDSAAYVEAREKLARAEVELESLKRATTQSQEQNAALKAELEKQKKDAEQALQTIRGAAATAAQESAATKAEIERQKLLAQQQQEEQRKATETAARELETLRRAAESASRENEAVRAEIERQKSLAQQQLEEMRKATGAARDENLILRSDISQQRTLIDSLKDRMASTDQAARQDTKTLTQMLDLYRQSIEKQGTADQETTRLLASQITEQKRMLEEQARTQSTRNLMIIGGFTLLGILLLVFLLLVVRAQLRRRRTQTAAAMTAGYPSFALGAESAQQAQGRIGGTEALLLEALPEPREAAGAEPTPGETGMYRDLLRAERLKRMHDQMKQGTLKWETVREYIGELEKGLRVEVLRVVENKILEGDGIDPRAVLAVLSPFLTEHDDYLREKAESLVKSALSAAPRGRQALLEALPGAAEAVPEQGEAPLSLRKLLEISENLKKLLKERERSVETAKVARGIARQLGFSAADAEMLYKSALAHDAGYLQLDPDRLRRIIGRQALSDADFKFIQSHARKGLDYFRGVKIPQEFKDAIVSHYERNDGSGYPKGLKAGEIPLFAKIVGVAETYVALTSARPYREKLGSEAALAVIRDGIGRKFDREHVEALIELARRSGESA